MTLLPPVVIIGIAAAALAAAPPQIRQEAPPSAPGADASWRLWGGPNRDFIVPGPGPLPAGDRWISNPPRTVWQRPLGDGYSAIAVDGRVLYTGYRRGNDDVIVALDAETGRTIWEFAYAAPFRNGYAEAVGPGPYAMPQVVGDRVIAVSGIGQIHSLDKTTGKLVWSLDLYRNAGGTRLDFGYSSHPLPFEDSLIVLAGGSDRAVLRVRQSDGSTVWANGSLRAAHSSPVLMDVDGEPQIVVLLADEVAGLDPRTGDVLWRHPHRTDNGLAVSTPVRAPGNRLLVTSAYSGGARLLQLERSGRTTTAREVWHNPRVQAHFGTVIRDGETAYLSNGQSVGILTAVDLQTGRIRWQARDFVKAQLVSVGDRLVILDEDGHLGLGIATPEWFQAIAKWPVLSSVSWTPPTVAGGRVYLRDRRTIVALDLTSLR